MIKQCVFRIATAVAILATIIAANAGTYTSDFSQYLAASQSKDQIRAIITMADRVDLESLKAGLSAGKADRQQWHEAVVRALQNKATESQADILAKLAALEKQGVVSSYENMWLGNIIIVTATKSALDEIVQRTDVDQIAPDYEIESIKDIISEDAPAMKSGVENGLKAIRADKVWAMGYTGAGRLVSSLDTGVNGEHEAFARHWRGLDQRYEGNPGWAWYDPVTATTFPFDEIRHGTHTMGTMCGLGERFADTIGVAFGADWISAGVIDRVNGNRTVVDALTAFQWVADPDGDPETVWDVPDVCGNSWGLSDNHGYAPCDATLWDVIDAAEAAGVVVLFSAGNEGESGPESVKRPADRATTNLNCFSIGAVDSREDDYPIARFSSRGPSHCTPDGSAAIKPELCAPGVFVRSAFKNDYIEMDGTSMAVPHVAGVVALMREANPDLSSDEIKQILLDTARDLGEEGEDNVYGKGMIDAYEAVLHALALRHDFGALAGTITDENTGNPIEGAIISVSERNLAVASNSAGRYYMFLPAGTQYDIEISSPGFLPINDQQSAAAIETTTVNYVMEPKVATIFTVSFGNGDDIAYRTFYIKGSWDNDGFYDESRSGDLLALTDNGRFPDETAGDGIFTGQVFLDRDLVNTYEWGLYTENYGVNSLDDAFLAHGSDFQIANFQPVHVPTLAPNPSGSDNNFIFSVDGDNDLTLDLAPYVNGSAYKWGASTHLDAGTTYSFTFRVMHSDEVVYGLDGVGGGVISYTPAESGDYNFIFNDNDDSYEIELSSSDGPPSFLNAISGEEHHIPVIWSPPGITSSVEVAYDDGVAAHGWYSVHSTIYMGVMFVPESYPVLIDSIMVHVITLGDAIWPWPDDDVDPVGISLFLDNGSGYPADEPAFFTIAAAEPGQWIRLDVNGIVLTSGNFWVFMNIAVPGGYEGLARDAVTDYPANQWYSADQYGTWSIGSPYGGDNMIRAKVFSDDASTWLAYDDGVPAQTVSSTGASVNSDLFINSNSSLQIESNPNPLAYYPHILSDPPMLTETEMIQGYNLYRSTTPHPYNQGQKINTGLILSIYYDDWGDDVYGPIVNGTTYFYEASAVYNVGGSYVEVGPSNEAWATPVNKPPVAPENLTGVSNDRTVTLNWDVNTDYDIVSYNVYRRRTLSEGYVLAGSVNHPITTFSEDIAGDGVYRYKVSALDAQGLESDDFSNRLDLTIGTVRPGMVAGSSDLEYQVKLKWRDPGNANKVPLKVALINSSQHDADNSIMQNMIDMGVIDDYDVFVAEDTTPVLGDIDPYDMVMIWSAREFADNDSLGNVLADYTDLGKPALLFDNCFRGAGAIGGRFMDDYCPFGVTDICTHELIVYLGEYDVNSPLMKDVDDFYSVCVSHPTLQNDGKVAAYWNNDYLAVGYSQDYSIACINAWVAGMLDLTGGDVTPLIRNAINFIADDYGANPDSYKIYRSESESGDYELLIELPGDANEYVDSSILTNSAPYYYRITAIWDGEESRVSNTAEAQGQN
jgi:serine protease AprX